MGKVMNFTKFIVRKFPTSINFRIVYKVHRINLISNGNHGEPKEHWSKTETNGI